MLFSLSQGDTSGNASWDAVKGILKDPGYKLYTTRKKNLTNSPMTNFFKRPEQEACHATKPILVDTGEVTKDNKVPK